MTWPLDALPRCHVLGAFRLEALGPVHNERDHAAWMGSIDHIRATPGFGAAVADGDDWPYPMSLEANLGDLTRHLAEFDAGEAFAFSVLAHPSDEIVGCVYLDLDKSGEADVMARSWTVAAWGDRDSELASGVHAWASGLWPGTIVRWPARSMPLP